jgi:NitT/TauT family transport system substrate-binding protein
MKHVWLGLLGHAPGQQNKSAFAGVHRRPYSGGVGLNQISQTLVQPLINADERGSTETSPRCEVDRAGVDVDERVCGGVDVMDRRHFGLGLGAWMAGCGGGGKDGAPVRIAVPGGIMEPFPVYLCQELGHLREEGVDGDVEGLPNARGWEALIGGSADVFYATASGVMTAAAQGKLLKIFLAGQRTSSAMLVVPEGKAARIRSVRDLKGGVVGVTSLGSAQHSSLTVILRKHGLSPADVKVIAHGLGPQAIAALEHGEEDAGMINGSAFNLLKRRRPGMKVLVDPRTPEGTVEHYGSRDYVNYSLMATPEWLARNGETARKLARAMKRTLAWVREHPAEEVLAKMPGHLRSTDAEADLESVRMIIRGVSEDGRMPEGGPEILRQIADVPMEKLREHGIELSQVYTNEFVGEGK